MDDENNTSKVKTWINKSLLLHLLLITSVYSFILTDSLPPTLGAEICLVIGFSYTSFNFLIISRDSTTHERNQLRILYAIIIVVVVVLALGIYYAQFNPNIIKVKIPIITLFFLGTHRNTFK